MPRSRKFAVKEGRFFYKCPSCQGRRVIRVAPTIRRRLVCCQRCGEKLNCILDRRHTARMSQSGRVLLLIGGNRAEVNLFDISERGVGFEVDIRSGLRIAVGREIELKCSWNPRLLNKGRYVVRSVRGVKIGAEHPI